jgi:hypothetical protein
MCAVCAGKLPLMEIVFLLEREEEELEDYRAIHFKSVYGMPIKGEHETCTARCLL